MISIKVTSKKEKKMDKDKNNSLMVIFIKVYSEKVNYKVKVFIYGLMVPFIKDSLKMDYSMEKVSGDLKKMIVIKEPIETTRNMEKESIDGKMGWLSKASSSKIMQLIKQLQLKHISMDCHYKILKIHQFLV